tara:strand:- start:2214 stop:2453 length:240 start_codon:yes stop_codon:yes gene_type:complete
MIFDYVLDRINNANFIQYPFKLLYLKNNINNVHQLSNKFNYTLYSHLMKHRWDNMFIHYNGVNNKQLLIEDYKDTRILV